MQVGETALNVLVVDDIQDSADTLAALITMMGHSARAAYTAAEGIRMASDSVPDLIFHDLAMPQLNGFDAVRSLRNDPRFARTTIVALSAYTTQVFIDDRQSVFDRFITKPIRREELSEILAAVADRIGHAPQ